MGEMGYSFNFKMTLYHKKTKEEGRETDLCRKCPYG